jgi:hypothetical protein
MKKIINYLLVIPYLIVSLFFAILILPYALFHEISPKGR